MKLAHKLCLGIFALALTPAIALAEKPSVKQWAQSRIEKGLMRPLASHETERSKFSRVQAPPRERRLTVLANSLSKDAHGRAYVAYKVDVRYGKNWKEDFIGCVYKKSGNIFVKRGDQYRPAEFLLGKNVKPVPGVCSAGNRASVRH